MTSSGVEGSSRCWGCWGGFFAALFFGALLLCGVVVVTVAVGLASILTLTLNMIALTIVALPVILAIACGTTTVRTSRRTAGAGAAATFAAFRGAATIWRGGASVTVSLAVALTIVALTVTCGTTTGRARLSTASTANHHAATTTITRSAIPSPSRCGGIVAGRSSARTSSAAIGLTCPISVCSRTVALNRRLTLSLDDIRAASIQ